jgi:histidine triad (HIT) family protein
MDNCLFCRIVARSMPAEIVYENNQTLAFLDIKPVNPGHVLVIPKNHYADFVSTPSSVLEEIVAVAQKLAPVILAATGSPAFNIGVNNGKEAGQVVSHMHLHVMPRHADDGHEMWHGREYTPGEMARVAGEIRGQL